MIELIDTQNYEEDEKDIEIEKWSEYIEKYITLEQQDSSKAFDDDLKEALIKRPVFLTRNAHVLKQKFGNNNNSQLKFFSNSNLNIKSSTHSFKENNSAKEFSKTNALEEISVSKSKSENQNKIKYNPNNTILIYRRNTFKNSRKVNIILFTLIFMDSDFIRSKSCHWEPSEKTNLDAFSSSQ